MRQIIGLALPILDIEFGFHLVKLIFMPYAKLLFVISFLFLISCQTKPHNASTMATNKTPDEKSSDSTYIISVPVVAKPFYKKNNVRTDFNEYYLQRSIQDYFIKFCEGKVSREELEKALSQIEGDIKVLKLEVEFKKGLWDVCDGNMNQQSRVGDYVILLRIIQ
jgi:hypothetical protein